jgi:hypothetical protein
MANTGATDVVMEWIKERPIYSQLEGVARWSLSISGSEEEAAREVALIAREDLSGMADWLEHHAAPVMHNLLLNALEQVDWQSIGMLVVDNLGYDSSVHGTS